MKPFFVTTADGAVYLVFLQHLEAVLRCGVCPNFHLHFVSGENIAVSPAVAALIFAKLGLAPETTLDLTGPEKLPAAAEARKIQ